MIFTSPTEYAIRGLSEMVLRERGGHIMLDELVAGTDLPRDFLAKIFQKLVHAGILKSSKGRGGGFSLARPAEQITLMQIAQAVEGPMVLDTCVCGLGQCNDEMACPQHELYKPIRHRLKDYCNSTTLLALAEALRVKLTQQPAQPAAADATSAPQAQQV